MLNLLILLILLILIIFLFNVQSQNYSQIGGNKMSYNESIANEYMPLTKELFLLW